MEHGYSDLERKKEGLSSPSAQTLAYKAVRSVFELKAAQTARLPNTDGVPQPLKSLSAGRGSYLTKAVIQKYSQPAQKCAGNVLDERKTLR